MSRTLSSREKLLSWLVGGTVALLLNLFVLEFFFSTHAKLRRDLANRQALLTATQGLLAHTALWSERDQWLSQHQPKLENEATAGAQLLNHVREVAKRHGVTTEQPAIGDPERQPRYTAVAVTLDTKSPWKALPDFLQAVQGPEEFVVLESARLNIDPADQTQMRGHFRIAKWFAPK